MGTIQWRPEVNALTMPQSYAVRCLPKESLGREELAAKIARNNPNWNISLVSAILKAEREQIKEELINGNRIAEEDGFTCSVSVVARLDAPDDPLPSLDRCLQVKIHASRRFIDDVRQAAQLERLPMSEKLPVINTIKDTRLKLNDVLYADGLLKISGSKLFFTEGAEDCGCVIEGTRSGRALQQRFGTITDTSILLVPDIPPQNAAWNNEYTLSVSTRYTEHGTLRTSTYKRRLRSLLSVPGLGQPNPPATGILTGSAANPYVVVVGGVVVNGDEMLRIQAVLDPQDGHLAVNLLDMKENGRTGTPVAVTGDGGYTLLGFAGSAVTSLNISVEYFTELVNLIKTSYTGRLVDVLYVQLA